MSTKQSKQVYHTEEIELQDGTVITLRPLPIRPLRRVMAEWAKMPDAKPTEDNPEPSTDILVNMGMICLEKKGVDNLAENQEEFEDVVDSTTLFRIIKVCAGIDLETPVDDDDPKATE